MNWTKWRAALLLVLILTVGAGVFFVARGGAAEWPSMTDGTVWTAAAGDEPETEPADTPVARAGWPFQQLPMVAKYEVPVPRLAMTLPPPLGGPLPRMPYRPSVPMTPGVPVVPGAPGAVPPFWLLAPLAAGGFVGGSDGVAPVPTTSVVPEPSTIILLSTGLVLLGVQARRRRKPESDD